MQELSKNKAGLILASFLGLWHFTWSLLVVIGVAQTLLDWIYYLHFLNNPFHVAAFSIGTAALLIVIASVLGYIFGWLLALLWNVFHKKAADSNLEGKVERKLAGGKPERVIRDVAKEQDADLVVIGRGADSAVGRLRSSAYAIIRESPCPVISV